MRHIQICKIGTKPLVHKFVAKTNQRLSQEWSVKCENRLIRLTSGKPILPVCYQFSKWADPNKRLCEWAGVLWVGMGHLANSFICKQSYKHHSFWQWEKTLAIESLLKGQAKALTQTTIYKALDGDSMALRLFIDLWIFKIWLEKIGKLTFHGILK